jgi:hypothetical protein
MEFTVGEEAILKALAKLTKANAKLAAANLVMGKEIRAEFSIIDAAKRALHEPTITPLQADVKNAQDALKAECET